MRRLKKPLQRTPLPRDSRHRSRRAVGSAGKTTVISPSPPSWQDWFPHAGAVEPPAGLAALARAVSSWVESGRPELLLRWLDRDLDGDGVPVRLPVVAWAPCLAALAEGQSRRPYSWPAAADARIEGLLRAVLRFCRPDGAPVFGPASPALGSEALLRFWADRLSDPALAAVVDRWFPVRSADGKSPGVPPLPADARPNRPLAMLRADWTHRGDFVAIDQRDPLQPCRLELFGRGQSWLGPDWVSGTAFEPSTPARPTRWLTGPSADVAEWTFQTPTARVTRTVVLLRGRQLALLADQVHGPNPSAAMRVAIALGVAPASIPESRMLALCDSRGRSARVLPLLLPGLAYVTERGSLSAEGRELVLRQLNPGKRCWLPLLVSWSPERNRRLTRWRVLTVSDRSRICRPDVACALRVAWGAGESLVIYRSLAKPTVRAFLGHQTDARLLIGLFTKAGEVEPLLKVED